MNTLRKLASIIATATAVVAWFLYVPPAVAHADTTPRSVGHCTKAMKRHWTIVRYERDMSAVPEDRGQFVIFTSKHHKRECWQHINAPWPTDDEGNPVPTPQ